MVAVSTCWREVHSALPINNLQREQEVTNNRKFFLLFCFLLPENTERIFVLFFFFSAQLLRFPHCHQTTLCISKMPIFRDILYSCGSVLPAQNEKENRDNPSLPSRRKLKLTPRHQKKKEKKKNLNAFSSFLKPLNRKRRKP